MQGQTCTAGQASASGHARPGTAADRAASVDGTARQHASTSARIPPLTDPQGSDVTAGWPLHSYLELGALPSAIPCARLHTRQLAWEWQLTAISADAELLVSEIVTNAVHITRADGRNAPVRLWLLADQARLLILVHDISPLPPVPVSASGDTENGRGLLLVDTLSTRWGHFLHPGGGKVVWSLIRALPQPAQHAAVSPVQPRPPVSQGDDYRWNSPANSPCAVPKPCVGPDLVLYARRLCSYASFTCS